MELDQIHHDCFAHAFVEHLFERYWLAAEYFRSWNYDRSRIGFFVDGKHVKEGTKGASRMRRVITNTGNVADFFSIPNRLVSNGLTFDRENLPSLVRRTTRYVRFSRVFVGGRLGRSIWTREMYGVTRLHQESDNEYTNEERRTAYLHFIEYLGSGLGFPSRLSPSREEGLSEGKILVLNRESDRRLQNAGKLQRALAKSFPGQVHDRVVTPSEMTLESLARIIRSSIIVITPHGAHMANLAFLLPGRAVIEVQGQGCFAQGSNRLCYSNFAWFSGIRHVRVSSPVPKNVKICNTRDDVIAEETVIVQHVSRFMGEMRSEGYEEAMFSPIRSVLESPDTLRTVVGNRTRDWKVSSRCSV